jgi:hypothetical protein
MYDFLIDAKVKERRLLDQVSARMSTGDERRRMPWAERERSESRANER